MVTAECRAAHIGALAGAENIENTLLNIGNVLNDAGTVGGKLPVAAAGLGMGIHKVIIGIRTAGGL